MPAVPGVVAFQPPSLSNRENVYDTWKFKCRNPGSLGFRFWTSLMSSPLYTPRPIDCSCWNAPTCGVVPVNAHGAANDAPIEQFPTPRSFAESRPSPAKSAMFAPPTGLVAVAGCNPGHALIAASIDPTPQAASGRATALCAGGVLHDPRAPR